MFVCTLRKGGLRKLAVVAVCGVVLAGAAITVGVVRNKGDAVDAAAQGGALSQQITGAQDVATFLQGYGVEVDPTTAEVSTVTVPRKWDDNFKAFNEVIKESGLDLSRVKKYAFEEAEHAAKFAELLGEVVTNSTKKNLELRAAAEAGACEGKFEIAKRAKQLNYDAIHDTVHEMAKDEARHGAGFAGLLKRYF